jgi:protein-S-isoprenylcysteine O-methyltransferase Ste14
MNDGSAARGTSVSQGRALLLHPGFLFITSLAAAGLTEYILPLQVTTHLSARGVVLFLTFLLAVGSLLVAWSLAVMRSHGTPFEPGSTPEALVTRGPFRRSRNPMYLALLCFSTGFAILGQSFWFFAATAALAAILDRIVIPREEKVMGNTFGEAYELYRSRVRRWV